MNLTAGYNADIARVYGINEALLLDNIVFWSRNSRRADGYCWFTANEFEVRTAIKEKAMSRAIKHLVEENVIEVKNTYIVGTQIKCRHFKLVNDPKMEVSQTAEMEVSETVKTTESGTVKTTESLYSSNRTLTEHNITKVMGETPESFGKSEINELFEYWEKTVGVKISSRIQPNRNACNNLIKKYGTSGVKQLVVAVQASHADKYAPRISDFSTLQSKLNELLIWAKKKGTTNAPARF